MKKRVLNRLALLTLAASASLIVVGAVSIQPEAQSLGTLNMDCIERGFGCEDPPPPLRK